MFDSESVYLLLHDRSMTAFPHLTQLTNRINTAIILKIAYDMDINSMDDEFVRLAQEATLGFSMAHALGATFVDLFPILRFLPGWFPGVRFRALSDKYRPISWKMVCAPFEKVKKDIVSSFPTFLINNPVQLLITRGASL